MHNFFEAKGQKLEAYRDESGVGWGFWVGAASPPLPPAARGLWSTVRSPNAFRCILSSKIASGGHFLDYLFQLKK